MHANIEQLLNMNEPGEAAAGDRQEQIDAAARAHVAACEACQHELQRLNGLRAELKALPEVDLSARSAEALWAAVNSRSGQRPTAADVEGGFKQWWPLGLAASLLVATFAVMLAPWQDAESPVVVAQTEPMRTVPDTAKLVARSQQLEQMLGSLQYEPRVVNARTAGTIARIEDQIAWIDYGLGEGSEGELSDRDANALWQQRVELMNSLVHVRYAQAQRVDF